MTPTLPPEDWMALMSSASKTWTLRARQAVLVLVLLACSSSLESSPPAQANSLAVLFSPSAGTFVGSETVTLSVQARADIHYTLDGSLPTVMSPIYRGPLTLDKSTRLRAVAIVPGDAGGRADGRRDPSPRKSTCAWTRIRRTSRATCRSS